MKKILILAGRYLPGHKDGGPLRTLINLTDALCNEYEFFIACYDRDHGDTEPYKGIEYGTWNTIGNAKVWYVPEGQFSKKLIMRLVEGKDVIYLTSFFEPYGYNTLLLKKEGKIKVPVALASMGVFSKDALAHKALKKRIFILGCKVLRLFKDITWSVTSELEAEDAKRVIGKNIKYVVAEDLPRTNVPGRKKGFDSTLRIVFLSRICEHKHPIIVIDAIEKMQHRDSVVFSLYGPIQEKEYWEKCLKKLEQIHYQWEYGGDVPSENVQEVLAKYDVFVLPSKSENYGHVVFEALSVGCIPVISNRTPWKELDVENIGFEVPLDTESFTNRLDLIAEMSVRDRKEMADKCVAYAQKKVDESLKKTGYRRIFG